MYTLTIISNLGEESFYYPSQKLLEHDEYLIWYFNEMLDTEIEIRTEHTITGTLKVDIAADERLRKLLAAEHKKHISLHIFGNTITHPSL